MIFVNVMVSNVSLRVLPLRYTNLSSVLYNNAVANNNNDHMFPCLHFILSAVIG
jgi:hypothetical protein